MRDQVNLVGKCAVKFAAVNTAEKVAKLEVLKDLIGEY